MYAIVALAGLAGRLMTYYVLKHFFPIRSAWLATALVTTAHATVEFSSNTDVVAQGAIIWPVAGWAILRWYTRADRSKALPWVLGLIVFLGGQISWFALTTI